MITRAAPPTANDLQSLTSRFPAWQFAYRHNAAAYHLWEAVLRGPEGWEEKLAIPTRVQAHTCGDLAREVMAAQTLHTIYRRARF